MFNFQTFILEWDLNLGSKEFKIYSPCVHSLCWKSIKGKNQNNERNQKLQWSEQNSTEDVSHESKWLQLNVETRAVYPIASFTLVWVELCVLLPGLKSPEKPSYAYI